MLHVNHAREPHVNLDSFTVNAAVNRAREPHVNLDSITLNAAR